MAGSTDAKTGEKIFGRHVAGLQNVGSYQVSGAPFITGSAALDAGAEHTITFPTVAKSILVINPGTVDVRVHFAPVVVNDGGDAKVYAQNHFLTVSGSAAALSTTNELRLDCKCAELYISNATSNDDAVYQVYAELTGIPAARMFALTGSGITQ
jgi:hypothetical protein